MSLKRKDQTPEEEIEALVDKMTDVDGIWYKFDESLWKVALIIAKKWAADSGKEYLDAGSTFFNPYLRFIQDVFSDIVSDAIKNSDLVRIYNDLLNRKIDLDEIKRYSDEREKRDT